MRNCPQCGAECATDHRFCPACGFPIGALRTAAGDPLIGRTLGGAYVILEHIGSGGMGRVYRAEQVSLGKTLAVKVIHPHLISDESATSRFYTEARASSRLNHPNSVSVLDFGRTDDGLLFLVMEFLRGKDLAHVLWEQGPLPASRAVNIMRQILAALSEAHDLGIIHRDIKPENILIEPLRTGGDFVKVVDFGLAKVRADVAPSVTMPGIVCGTPDYMAPEQGRGDPLDPRSDLYACGVLLFQVLTGRLPFEAESPTQIVLMHMTDPPPDPRTLVAGIPGPIAECTLKALEKEAVNRHQSAVEFAEALVNALAQSEGERDRGSKPKMSAEGKLPCPQCGAPLSSSVKFCGECGAKVTPAAPLAPSPPVTRKHSNERVQAMTQFDSRTLSFVGRANEIAQLDAARGKCVRGKMVCVRIQGEMGSGKRRLVQKFLEKVRGAGDATIEVGPDITWAGAAYAPVSLCVRRALGLSPGDDPVSWLDHHSRTRSNPPDRAIRAGFEELFREEGPPHLDGRARREAVVRAVMFALTEAASHAASGVAVVAFEQLHRTDTASIAALTSLTARTFNAPVLIIGTHTPRVDPRWLHSEVVPLRGLSPDEATMALSALLGTTPADSKAALDSAGDDVLPLYVDQLARWTGEGGGPAPPRLVDLVSARLERLPTLARRGVQALALIGEATPATLSRVLEETFDAASATLLRQAGWVTVETRNGQEFFQLTQGLLREVADSSIPSAARGDFHRRCAEVLSDIPTPLEARAIHAADADDPFQAMVLLERVGDRAVSRGDDLGAAHALRRGLERARRELVRGEVDEPERPMAIFARKLADALMRAGEAAEAEGVLREAMEQLPRTNVEWARLEGALARALYARGRTPDALRAIDNAVRTARRLGSRIPSVELLVARAELEDSLGNAAEALTHLKAADELLREQIGAVTHGSGRPSAPASEDLQLQRTRIDVLIRLSRAMRLAGDEMGSGEPLLEAREIADRLGLVTDRARCDAEGAERAEQLGDRRAAQISWRRAAQAARDAGDALAEAAYQDRDKRLGAIPTQAAGAK